MSDRATSTDAVVDIVEVRRYFIDLQSRICAALEAADGEQTFSLEVIEADNGGLARPRALAGGKHIEKAAVQFSHSIGAALPAAATERNPHLAGNGFQATAISLIVHPVNPHVPITHMNLRFFVVEAEQPVWYFGGGYDLTPCYPLMADIVHWHQTAKDAVGQNYVAMKQACDEYFYLSHRDECRGVGGIFFDDYNDGDFATSFDFIKIIGESFLTAYLPIFSARKDDPYDSQQRNFQLLRRGRYAEFNLAIDRGTKYGLQSGRRIESVLASLPPVVHWQYNYQPVAGSAEEKLIEYFLKPQAWLGLDAVDNSGEN